MERKKKKKKYKCAVSSCDSKLEKGMYQVPEHPVPRKQWLDAMQVQTVNCSAKVCWKHFRADQFKNPIDIENCVFGPLIKSSVPSLFLPGEPLIVDLDKEFSLDDDLGGEQVVEVPPPKEKAIPRVLVIHNNLADEHNYTSTTFDPIEEIRKLRKQNQLLKNKNDSLMAGKLPESVKRKVVIEKLQGKFTSAQIHMIVSKKPLTRTNKWKDEDYARAYRLRALSKKSYNILRKDLHYPTPGISTVDKKFSFIHVCPGIIEPAKEVLKLIVATLTEKEKNAGCCYDEIYTDNVLTPFLLRAQHFLYVF